jgi:hypothetical protein
MRGRSLPKRREEWRIEGLAARGPHPELADKLALFGQFVGDWEILECRTLEDDGTWSTSRGKLHWRWILEGRAVQDVWTTIDEKSQRSIPVGTTVRFYDPKIDAWHSVWLSPVQGQVKSFIGRLVGSEIVLEGKNDRGNSIRWIFSEIRPDSFRWRGEELRNPPSGWVLYEEMRIRRA